MFLLSTLEDNVRVAPQDHGKPAELAIAAVLETIFIDKVIFDLGLIVTIYDILEIDGGFVYHSDGGAHYRVRFRVIVFRPFSDEMIVGRVSKMDAAGVHISLGFFEDCIVPHHGLPEPSCFSEEEQVWIWQVDGHELYFEKDMPVRFKVQAVKFHPAPTLPEQQAQRDAQAPVLGTAQHPFIPLEVVARADGDGLGMVHWFAPEDDDRAE